MNMPSWLPGLGRAKAATNKAAAGVSSLAQHTDELPELLDPTVHPRRERALALILGALADLPDAEKAKRLLALNIVNLLADELETLALKVLQVKPAAADKG